MSADNVGALKAEVCSLAHLLSSRFIYGGIRDYCDGEPPRPYDAWSREAQLQYGLGRQIAAETGVRFAYPEEMAREIELDPMGYRTVAELCRFFFNY